MKSSAQRQAANLASEQDMGGWQTASARQTDATRRVVRIDPTYEASQPARLRIAAYARVSSDKDAQLDSFEAQVSYYTALITARDDWQLVDIYADEGITGTSTHKREEFQRLMRDCRRGKVDRVIVKSISRFCRNTVDCIQTVRELTALGVSVLFEKESIDTATMRGELMLTALSDFAQQESLSISGNQRTAVRMRMQSGSFATPSPPFGYRLVNKQLEVEEREAAVVRWIFHQYLAGTGPNRIAIALSMMNVPRRGDHTDWHKNAITYILCNERYIGDALWQKSFTSDTLPFQKIRNRGELERYYVTDIHPPIIDRATFERAQLLIEQRRRKQCHGHGPPEYPFTRKLICGTCGRAYRRKVNSGKIYWTCRVHDRNAQLCSGPRVRETEIERAFIRLYNKLRLHQKNILGAMVDNLYALKRSLGLDNPRVTEIIGQISKLTGQNRVLGGLAAQGYMDSALTLVKQNENSRVITRLREEKDRLCDLDGPDELIRFTRDLVAALEEGPTHLECFDAGLFGDLVDKIIVEDSETLVFRLFNRLELRETIERTVR